jgi:RNA binding exosome subunit
MNIIERRDIIFRTNFNSIVNEFELKYGNIIVVMEVMLKEQGAYEKIEKIKELINDIINENYMKNELSNSIPGSSNGE